MRNPCVDQEHRCPFLGYVTYCISSILHALLHLYYNSWNLYFQQCVLVLFVQHFNFEAIHETIVSNITIVLGYSLYHLNTATFNIIPEKTAPCVSCKLPLILCFWVYSSVYSSCLMIL